MADFDGNPFADPEVNPFAVSWFVFWGEEQDIYSFVLLRRTLQWQKQRPQLKGPKKTTILSLRNPRTQR